ncbi:hypothetical protein LEP48_00265 [Isoptericola sp. NEAU-Y5]|uniref:Secreted protein n=1 Tax=Isoptericola luteus TaxID=2879484 RepID=A0ABS7ZD82_9MICO|nr:hypothetical protein [Isoptericola sp. NEAU-Y5]MCA5891784.1 hypothetical protein [Isoptericola sp. NEAU-Y5]
MRRSQSTRRSAAIGLAAGVLTLGLALVPGTGTPAAVAEQANLPGVPEPGSPAAEWEAWAAEERAAAKATDWAADSEARGCVLEDVTVTDEVDRDYNVAMGAPADLVTHRVDLAESCSDAALESVGDGASRSAGATGFAATDLPSGNRCASTSGPGTACLSKGSGRVYASWKYRGSGTVTGFLRIYRVSASADGCPTGSTWLTGSSASWRNGTTRTISKTQTQNGGYSAHFWRKVSIGHRDWGGVCSVL